MNGLSWDVIKSMALEFELHPLSLEDMLHHGTASSRSKADWYKQHLFVSCVVHKTLESTLTEVNSIKAGLPAPGKPLANHLREQLGFHSEHHDDHDVENQAVEVSDLPRYDENDPGAPVVISPALNTGANTPDRPGSYAAYQVKLQEAFNGVQLPSEEDFRTLSPHVTGMSKILRRKAKPSKRTYAADKARHSIDALTKDVKVRVHVEQLSIYLLRDGTVLSFSQDTGFHGRLSGIFGRIASRDDILRGSEDGKSSSLRLLLGVAQLTHGFVHFEQLRSSCKHSWTSSATTPSAWSTTSARSSPTSKPRSLFGPASKTSGSKCSPPPPRRLTPHSSPQR